MLAKAIAITAEAFKNKLDKGGKPYILHCLHVMNAVAHLGEEAMQIAVMHDLLEDCKKDWNTDKLLKKGFSIEVVRGVETLTHDPKVDYESYIRIIANHPIPRAIKMADLEHNSDITRMKSLRKKDFDRLEKYFKAYAYLKD